ncbi:FAD-binding oxidoreductase [Acuticoccus sp. M5D2P5]|uniref:NAD(P)/FAD-dependent oxidoreductase n=1 Tax=Acuticoccus kalidii TaxID=2910977 RepID=UPI001F314534|nr:FAD-binding oxidoreductase [Acuticoccus kalidii]MCF3932251.1 FAD-binding oxidoreductase [Acuticoccus kalidii]
MNTPESLPRNADIVVIGGGILGVSTAIFLNRMGRKVVLLEKGRIAGEQSSRNWGWIRKQGRDPRELPMMIESARLWQRLASECGEDIGFGVNGTTYLALNEAELAEREAWLASAEGFQLDTKLLSPAEVDALLGLEGRRFKGALHTPSDMTAEPRLAAPAFARLAAAEGVTVVEGCAARTVEMEGGRIKSVATERGEIQCEAAILSGGAWSRTFLENLGIYIPQLAVRASAFRTSPLPEIHTGGFGATGASLRRRPDGGYTVARSNAATFELIPAAFRHLVPFMPVIKKRWKMLKIRGNSSFFGPLGHHRWTADDTSPFEAIRVFDPEPDMELLNTVRKTAMTFYPSLGEIDILEAWGGMIDVTPDEVPIIDEAPTVPGLWIATGLSGHGFGIGPGAGMLAAELATGRTPSFDTTQFRLDRFKSGRKAAA